MLTRWTLPGIWAYAAFITANNYLQAQKIVRPQVVTSAVVLAVHPPLNWLCIYTLGWFLCTLIGHMAVLVLTWSFCHISSSSSCCGVITYQTMLCSVVDAHVAYK